jgi:hypothetical protein
MGEELICHNRMKGGNPKGFKRSSDEDSDEDSDEENYEEDIEEKSEDEYEDEIDDEDIDVDNIREADEENWRVHKTPGRKEIDYIENDDYEDLKVWIKDLR